ncbi:leucine-rich repeat-containing protein 70-like isoform X2 [Condylostylus longicornis]|uniref:leucine-rich repeat-containing protein 70-like isoform X2 n=1 Tax=Condylostylus longicornis TaxID=2530218 RepID=UPI00244DC323|nr:leucine-rich repeat-containing protein 70-like isoform X2 [Condylostylus longicornis]
MNSHIKKQVTTALLLLLITFSLALAQHEEIPYAEVENICITCSCQNFTNTKILNCHDRSLKHILARWPEQFGTNHTGIEIHATFSKNDIEILQQLPATDGILYFSARRCKIQKLQSKIFIDSPNIFRLDLSFNQLTEEALTPDVFKGPYNEHEYESIKLKELDLSYNYIRDLDSKLFEHINQLSVLNLAHNRFSKFDDGAAEAIGCLKYLEVLDISFNHIKILPDNIFQNLNLHNLNLKNNNFTSIPNSLNMAHNSLESLDISYNPIEKIHTDDFNNFNNLKYLNMSDMMTLKKIEVGTFSVLTKLEELHCKNNFYLTSIHLPTESKFLKILDISNGNLNSIVLEVDLLHNASKNGTLNFWPYIKTIILAENPWNCDCTLAEILKQFKNITIEKDDLSRCSSPIELTGTKLSDLNAVEICNGQHKNRFIIEDPSSSYTPYVLRAKHVVYILITIGLVILSGIIVGFGLSYGRRRLKSDVIRLKSSPIRYISVRNSS